MTSVPLHLDLGTLSGLPTVFSRSRSETETFISASRPIADAGVHERPDEELFHQYVRGDRDALRRLVTRYREDLMRFLVRFLGSHAAAEDVFQETFLQVHLSAETFDVTRRFKPWLFTIAANKARDHHRRSGRRKVMSLSAAISPTEDRTRFVDLLDAGLPTPEVPLEEVEQARIVRGVVDGLPVHLREILMLSYFQRMSYAQIADSLEIPLGTVKSRLHAAVAAFARAWKTAREQEESVEEDDMTKEKGR